MNPAVPLSPRHIRGGDPYRSRHSRRVERRRPARGGSLGFGPSPLRVDRDRRRRGGRFGWLRRIEPGAIFAGLFGLGTLIFVIVLAYRGTRVEVNQTGLEDGAVLNAAAVAALDVQIELPSPDDAASSEVSFDGEALEEPEVDGEVIRWRPPEELEEGEHTLTLSVPRVLVSNARFSWTFTYDVTPPAIEAPAVADPVGIDQPTRVSGTVERGASVLAGGREVEVERDGSFTLSFTRPPAGPIVLEAVDRAGNRTTSSVVIPVALPGMRAVHVSAAAWSSQGLQDGVIQLLDEGRIDTVQLDLKDEEGVVGFDANVPRAAEIGAVAGYYNLDEAVALIEEHGGRVVGRVAAFTDPILARSAWAADQTDQVIQTPAGQPYDAPGRFTNLAHPEVQRYNLDIALDAVTRGVDNILWDGVRRPGDRPDNVVVPQLRGSASDAVVGFLANAHNELRRRGAYQGVVVEGLSADQGDLYAQDVAQMARRADYLVPEIHPADWRANDYGVASPIAEPGELVVRVLARFLEASQDGGALLVPSLQDFSRRGVTYGEAHVRAQIDAARAAGSDRFLLWDNSATYTAEALDPQS
jgi:hypothetical protein